MSEPKTIKINEVEYVRKDSISEKVEKVDGMEYVIIRTYSAGVHIGYLESRDRTTCKLKNTRRIYKWAGAFTLSEMAVHGVTEPEGCKFSCVVSENVLQWIEVLSVTKKARATFQEVKDYEY